MGKILLITVILILIGAGGFYFWQQQNILLTPQTIKVSGSIKGTITPTPEKTTLKEYKNEKYKFAVTLPEGWEIRAFAGDGSGAGLKALGSENDDVVVDVLPMVMSDEKPIPPFDEYVKTAASREIQNYNSLASSKKITTTSGIIGYETTWNVQSLMGTTGGTGKSLPRTYFPLPAKYGQKTIQISLSNDKYLDIYETILTSLRYTE